MRQSPASSTHWRTVAARSNAVDSGTEKELRLFPRLPVWEVHQFGEGQRLNPTEKGARQRHDVRNVYILLHGFLRHFLSSESKNDQLTQREGRLRHNPNTPGKEQGDQAAPLPADRFGGSPELANLVSQSANVNQSSYRKLENKWAKAIKEEKTVKVEVNILYEDNGIRPSKFVITHTIDGKPTTTTISNTKKSEGKFKMKIFEDYFSKYQADMVSICLEYVNQNADYIYMLPVKVA